MLGGPIREPEKRGVVHLDANCHPGRARPDDVVARNQVTRFGSCCVPAALLVLSTSIAPYLLQNSLLRLDSNARRSFDKADRHAALFVGLGFNSRKKVEVDATVQSLDCEI